MMTETTKKLITFFKTTKLPDTAIIQGWQVNDVKKMVEAHIRYISASNNKKFIQPYVDRLEELKKLIENGKYDNNKKG